MNKDDYNTVISDVSIYLITLKRNTSRINQYMRELDYQPAFKDKIKIFYGIDGRQLSNFDRRRVTSNVLGKLSSNSIIGCALSHLLIWKKTNSKFTVVLEDDTILDYTKFLTLLDKIKTLDDGITFLYSVPVWSYYKKNNTILYPEFKELSDFSSMSAYVIPNSVAKKLYNYYSTNGVDYHIDTSLSYVINSLGIKAYHYINNDLTKQIDTVYTSSMTNHNEKLLLKAIENTQASYSLKLPILTLNRITFNGYLIAIVLLITLIITFDIYIKSSITPILYLISGLLTWDVIDYFLG